MGLGVLWWSKVLYSDLPLQGFRPDPLLGHQDFTGLIAQKIKAQLNSQGETNTQWPRTPKETHTLTKGKEERKQRKKKDKKGVKKEEHNHN